MNTNSLAFFAVARHSHSDTTFAYLVFTLLALLFLFMAADWLYETYFRYTDDPKRFRIITKHSDLYEASLGEILSEFLCKCAFWGGIVGGIPLWGFGLYKVAQHLLN